MSDAILRNAPDTVAVKGRVPASHTPAVEFNGVSKRYGNFTAVQDVGFQIESGTLVTLLGPSGCGKTSTLRLIAGLEHASAGRIHIDGQDVTYLSAAERDVSMVFQSYALFPHMTVIENVCYGLRAGGMKRTDAESAASQKLTTVGLAGYERRLPSELSGGQQQRVAVARAIVLEPKVLLFDEPLSNLDAKLRRRVRDDIRALQQQLRLTVVYVTHDQEEALAVSDRIVVMQNGRIVQDGKPRDLYERPASRFVADFIGNANFLPAIMRRVDGNLAKVDVGPISLHLAHRDLPSGPVEIAVRPQAVRIHPRLPGPNEIGGVVRKSAYLGSHMEYEIAIEGISGEILVIDSNVNAPLERGASVSVGIPHDGATIVRG